MPVTIKVQHIDLGWRATKRALSGLDGMGVDVGLFDEEQAQKGAYNELGTGTIPPRPWLSVAADTNVGRIAGVAEIAIGQVADRGMTPTRALVSLGAFLREAAKAVIEQQQVRGPALAAATVGRKGHGEKLIDSGEMLAAIDYEILQDGEVP